jgi:tripartite-type tricarboxylate transporter receptor subunit TctC
VIARINRELATLLERTDIKAAIAAQSFEILPSDPQQFGAFIKSELVKWVKVVKDSGMRID